MYYFMGPPYLVRLRTKATEFSLVFRYYKASEPLGYAEDGVKFSIAILHNVLSTVA
jgi:hypothetical protein